jgi:ABC-2 type transport system ATP-binding protein
MVNNLVEVRDLVVDRGGRRVLHGLDLIIEQGSVTGLLGPSGCGKSTLMRSLVGVQELTSGRVTIAGSEAGSKQLRSRIGYVTQAASVYDDLTVRENLAFFGDVLGADGSSVDRAIETVDLASHADAVVGRLSGGQRSRASLAVALLNTPDILVLDEPTVGLDPVLRRDLWALFHRLADDGAAVFVSSHVMDEADRCDRLLLMREGRIIADDTPQHIREKTQTEDIESAFLALVADADVTDARHDQGSDR